MSIHSLNGITTGMFIHDIDISIPEVEREKEEKGGEAERKKHIHCQ